MAAGVTGSFLARLGGGEKKQFGGWGGLSGSPPQCACGCVVFGVVMASAPCLCLCRAPRCMPTMLHSAHPHTSTCLPRPSLHPARCSHRPTPLALRPPTVPLFLHLPRCRAQELSRVPNLEGAYPGGSASTLLSPRGSHGQVHGQGADDAQQEPPALSARGESATGRGGPGILRAWMRGCTPQAWEGVPWGEWALALLGQVPLVSPAPVHPNTQTLAMTMTTYFPPTSPPPPPTPRRPA